MSQNLADLMARQQELQIQAAKERAELALHLEPLEKPLSWADKGIDAVRFIKSSPILWTSAFALLAHYKPKLASKVLAIGWGSIKLIKSAKSLL
jgi:hypothetical protein